MVYIIRKLIAVIILSTFTVGNIFAIGNEDDFVLHSLDELPSQTMEESMDEVNALVDSIVLAKEIEIPTENTEDIVSLIAARQSYKKQEEIAFQTGSILTPGFLVDPFYQKTSSIDLLFQNIREDALTSAFLGEDIANDMSGKV